MISMEGWRGSDGRPGALLCCPQEGGDITVFPPAASAWTLTVECPSDSRTPSGTPGPADTVPWRWGSSGVGGSPPSHCPNPRREGGEEGRAAGPAVSAEEGQVGSADGEAEAAQELILAVVQEGAEGQRQGQGRQLLLQRGTHDPITVHRACGPRVGRDWVSQCIWSPLSSHTRLLNT